MSNTLENPTTILIDSAGVEKGTLANPVVTTSTGGGGGGLTDSELRASPVPVSGPLTDVQLRASPVPVSGTFTSTGLTDTELRASPVPVSLASTTVTGSVAVTGPLTDTQLRATAVPVSGPLTDTQLRASAVPVSLTSTTITGSVAVTGPLTDVQLRATPVPVSGTVTTGGLTDTQLRASAVPVSLASTTITGSVAVTGPLTDAQLRATAVPISGTVTVTDGSGPLTIDGTVAVSSIAGTVAVSGPLTDTQLRATPVPVSGTVSTGGLTDTQLRASAVPVSGPLTDTQLRASSIPISITGVNTISGTVAVSSVAGTVAVTGPLTDTQLRATPVPVSTTSADTTATGALGALNAAVTVALAGKASAGYQLDVGTLIGTIVYEGSYDGGTTWVAIYGSTIQGAKLGFVTFTIANVATNRTLVLMGGMSHVRVRVSAYTSGTANITLKATNVVDKDSMFSAQVGGAAAPSVAQIAGLEASSSKLRAASVDFNGVLTVQDYAHAVASAAISGVADGISGRITTVATTELAIRNSVFVEQAAGAQRSILSTSVLDTAAGTGARTIRLTYYTLTAGVIAGPFTEDLTLNGVVAVNTVATNICYVESMHVLTAGTTLSNAGAINLMTLTAGAGVVMAQIIATEKQINSAHHYVASGEKCFVKDLYGSSTAATGNVPTFQARYRNPASATSPELPMFEPIAIQGSTGSKQTIFGTPVFVLGPAVITVYVTPENATSQVNRCQLSFYEI